MKPCPILMTPLLQRRQGQGRAQFVRLEEQRFHAKVGRKKLLCV
jgi:hypothetical protein